MALKNKSTTGDDTGKTKEQAVSEAPVKTVEEKPTPAPVTKTEGSNLRCGGVYELRNGKRTLVDEGTKR